MTSEITFRRMSDDDAQEVSALCIDLFNEFVAPTCTEEGRREFESDASPQKLRQRAVANHFFIALDKKTPVGAADMRRDGYLKLLFVKKSHQNRGIGRELLDRCIEEARAGGTPLSKVTVKAAVNAVSFYEKLGFVRDGDVQETKGIRYIPLSLQL
jgi:GNAT superfamily N-acetyltransferase